VEQAVIIAKLKAEHSALSWIEDLKLLKSFIDYGCLDRFRVESSISIIDSEESAKSMQESTEGKKSLVLKDLGDGTLIPVAASCDETMDPSQVNHTEVFLLSRMARDVIDSEPKVVPSSEFVRYEGPYHVEGPNFPYMRVI
jgi:hypothetical protein